MVNFYIINALGQDRTNSESCHTYSEIVIKGLNLKFQAICQKMAVFEQLNGKSLVPKLKKKFGPH